MIKAAVSVSADMTMMMSQDELQNYVLASLSKYISQEVAKKMTVTKTYDPLQDSSVYTGTLNLNPNNIGVSTYSNNITTTIGSNGTSSIYSQINLRVVEYTKNGKVTRVELQRLDESGSNWCKIPRIQIEE